MVSIDVVQRQTRRRPCQRPFDRVLSDDSLKDAARRQGGTAYDYFQVEMPFASLSTSGQRR